MTPQTTMDAEHVPALNLFFTPEFGDDVWAGLDYELRAPDQDRGEWILGRSPTAAITINLRTVSARHALISYSYSNDAWFLSDMGSENGTFLNGQRVTPPRRPVAIEIGDRIDLGPRARIFVVERSQDTIPEELGPPTIASTTPIETPPPAPPPPAPPPPAPAPAPPNPPKTHADSLYLAVQWGLTPTTRSGVAVRLGLLGVGVLVLVLWLP